MSEAEPVVRVRELSRTFGEFRAVDRVSFDVDRGEIFGFLGSNGAGKTTTIRVLCGLLAPTSGRAEVLGLDVSRKRDVDLLRRRIGYMSQRFSLYGDLTVEENLRFWGGAYGIFGAALGAKVARALEIGGLEERRRLLARDLPGGFRQRLALGCALLHDPDVVFLDEPTGGVDPEARRAFWDLIDRIAGEGTTVFVTTHSMDEAERCHRVAVMHAGRLLALDSVPALRGRFVPGSVVEIRVPDPAAAMARLEAMPGVGEVSLFGDRLHALLADPEARGDVERRLRQEGATDASVLPITPTLEDVFLDIVAGADAAGGPA
jgi:ABC-2 type transport system ATP-binding protein